MTALKIILAVDDEPGYLEVIKFEYSGKGFTIFSARNADDALAVLKRESIDLVITDMKMPGKDGLDLVIQIRKTLPDLPIIIMTGYAMEDRLKRVLEFKRTVHIHKPFDLDKLGATVSQLLSEEKLLS